MGRRMIGARFVVFLATLVGIINIVSSYDGDANAEQSAREVTVQEAVVDSAVADVVYLGSNHECVLVTTKSKRLHYSKNSGESWIEITDQIDSGGVLVDRIIVNPTDKTVAVLQATRKSDADGKRYPYIYVSEDSGSTWRRAWGKKHSLHSWVFHPTNRDWALISWWSGDCGGDRAGKAVSPAKPTDPEDREPCVHKLMITKDLGKTLVQIATYVLQFNWGSAAVGQASRVYLSSFKSQTGDQGRMSFWTKEADFSYIDIDHRGQPQGKMVDVIQHGNKFLIANEYILVAKVKDEDRQTVQLMVSDDGAKSFEAALLPSGMDEFEETWYTVLDTSEGAVMLHISDANGLKDTGRVFVSDAKGYRFSQSLDGNVRSSHGDCEFDKVSGLAGVYLANVVVPNAEEAAVGDVAADDAEKAAEAVEQEAASGSSVERRHGRKSAKPGKDERVVRSVMSFDKGGAWSLLKPPRVDSAGKEYECGGKPLEQCALHLHGMTSSELFAPFYSSESSVGIIMGTGNVGSSLRFEPEETSTFLSRDGGLTWMEAHKGAYIYEFGDHGGLVLMADDLKRTTQVVFTWNEGQSWYDFTVSSTPFEVDNILTEPNVVATSFIMFGTRGDGQGVLYHMKFDALKFPQCQGALAADSVSSDYETWSPSDGAGSETCILGQQLTYTRRKRTSQCFNGEQFERPVVKKTCPCTREDYVCDAGFSRPLGSTDCVFNAESMPPRLVPAMCSGIHRSWQTVLVPAYRKVPGDVCSGGWTPEQGRMPCPSVWNTPGHPMKWTLALVLLAVLLYLGYTRCASRNQKGSMFMASAPRGGVLATCFGLVSGVAGWLSEKVSGARRGFATHAGVGYKSVFLDDMGHGHDSEQSLDDFMDDGAQFDDTPPVYKLGDAFAARQLGASERTSRAPARPGGVQSATAAVPKLSAPSGPSSSPVGMDFDEDLL